MPKSEFVDENTRAWENAVRAQFPLSIPSACMWESPFGVEQALLPLCKSNLTHVFYPTGGGNDLSGVRIAGDGSCIELSIGGGWNIVKPKRLTFRCLDFRDLGWAYFYLEAETMDRLASEESDELSSYEEGVIEIKSGVYVTPETFERQYQDNEDMALRDVPTKHRWLAGSFAFFAKSSPYNLCRAGNFDAYNGTHAKLGGEKGFSEFLKKNQQSIHRPAAL